ncbi:MAG: CDP-diacylglycerol--glycerol-3-phosphate 3-phosphatidyltransferase [Myxococcales bacterium]|nr:CDP-diacylglycerol--glycerol-3-phosphate 3-phosphatidyltransferase [Myxococcales bacterium]
MEPLCRVFGRGRRLASRHPRRLLSGDSTGAGGAEFLTVQKAKFRPLRDEITDIPNLITLSRIALIPLILIFIDNYSYRYSALAALIFAFAAATDALDGYLARRLNLVTVVGKFLDPLADKLIVLSTLVMLVAKGRAPAWLVIALMSRELAITGLRAIASQEGFVIAAGAGGKTKTALQLTGIIFLLFHFSYPILFFDYALSFHEIGLMVLYVSLVISILSAVEYFRFFAAAASKQAEDLAIQGITRAGQKEKAKTKRKARARLRRVRRIERGKRGRRGRGRK